MLAIVVIPLVIVLVIVIILFNLLGNKTKTQETYPHVEVIPERIESKSKSQCFKIAGIHNYCNWNNIGPISGELIDDPKNKYDKEAVMIVDANISKKLGYISRDEKTAYRNIAEGKTRMPFIGYIESFINDDGEKRLFGVVRTYSADEDIVTEDAQNDWTFLCQAFEIKSYEKRMEVLKHFKY